MDSSTMINRKKDAGWEEVVKELVGFLKIFIVIFAVLKLLVTFVILNAYVPSESMEPILKEGYRMIGTRHDRTDIDRYDIMVFRFPDDEEEYFVKRVIGLPGECIEIKPDGHVYADGVRLKDHFIKEKMEEESFVFNVPEDCYFMMGDNRNESWDSRYWDRPYVTEDEMLAKMKVIYWPLKRVKWLNNTY